MLHPCKEEIRYSCRTSTNEEGLLRELSPGPLAPGARIIPLDQAASAIWRFVLIQCARMHSSILRKHVGGGARHSSGIARVHNYGGGHETSNSAEEGKHRNPKLRKHKGKSDMRVVGGWGGWGVSASMAMGEGGCDSWPRTTNMRLPRPCGEWCIPAAVSGGSPPTQTRPAKQELPQA